MTRRRYGRTSDGQAISEADIDRMAAEAEAGYDVESVLARRGRRGRPLLGSGPATVESVRLDPDLRDALQQRAEEEGRTSSDVIRDALRNYLAS